jgi:hypothetical protein
MPTARLQGPAALLRLLMLLQLLPVLSSMPAWCCCAAAGVLLLLPGARGSMSCCMVAVSTFESSCLEWQETVWAENWLQQQQ